MGCAIGAKANHLYRVAIIKDSAYRSAKLDYSDQSAIMHAANPELIPMNRRMMPVQLFNERIGLL